MSAAASPTKGSAVRVGSPSPLKWFTKSDKKPEVTPDEQRLMDLFRRAAEQKLKSKDAVQQDSQQEYQRRFQECSQAVTTDRSPENLVNLADCLLKTEPKKAVALYEEAGKVEDPYPKALVRLGRCCEKQLGMDKTDLPRAFKLYQDAMNLEEPGAEYHVAFCLETGVGIKANEGRALMHYKHHVETIGDVRSRLRWGYLLEKNGDRTAAREQFSKVVDLCDAAEFLTGSKLFTHVMEGQKREEISAALSLAYCQKEGRNKIEEDIDSALAICFRLAERGDYLAVITFADCFAEGRGVRADAKFAATLYQICADKKNAVGLYKLAMCYLKQRGVDKDKDRAVALLEEAANLGNTDAMLRLSAIFDKRESAEDKARALALCTQAKTAGDKRADFYVAASTQGKDEDIQAYQGQLKEDLRAILQLAHRVEADSCRTSELHQKCERIIHCYPALQVHVYAGCYDQNAIPSAKEYLAATLCVICQLLARVNSGEGIAQDKAWAIVLVNRLIDKGEIAAVLALADCLIHGRGVSKDEKFGAKIYHLMAKKGNNEAKNRFAICQLLGTGVKKDEAEAANVLLEAAKAGHPHAVTNFMIAYLKAGLKADDQNWQKILTELKAPAGLSELAVNGTLGWQGFTSF